MKCKRPAILILSAAGSLISAIALAGSQVNEAVTFDTVLLKAVGDLGWVRKTPDTTQYIGCTSTGGNFASCFAVDSTGLGHSCVTTDPEELAQVRSLRGDPRLVFFWTPTTGLCDGIVVVNNSETAPK